MDPTPATAPVNHEFELRGINHLALVCSDMDRTVDFYTGVLGMPLVKTIDLPAGSGKHFFFGLGNGDSLAFFWFPGAPPASPGVAAAGGLPASGRLVSGVGSMNHVAFDVRPELMSVYKERLEARGVECTAITNHDDSTRGVSRDVHPGVFMQSLYFFDPDGILLEFACWTGDHAPDTRAVHVPRAVSA